MRSLLASRSPAARRPQPDRRPGLERLEGRALLSGAGSLDATFGTGGVATASFTSSDDYGRALLLQPDGKAVVVGDSANNSRQGPGFALARYTTAGAIDGTFGSGGKVTTAFSGTAAHAYAETIYPAAGTANDGKIVAAGSANNDFALVRYNTNGSLDASFGSKGKVTTALGNYRDEVGAVLVLPGGKLLAAGDSADATYHHFALARYNANGTLDTTFGSAGKVVTNASAGDSFINAAALQADGKVVVVGQANLKMGNGSADCRLIVARYNADGTLDASFGPAHTGIVLSDAPGDGLAVAIQPADGKIVTAGNDALGTWQVARFDTAGDLDPTFGSGGLATFSPVAGTSGVARAVAIQPDGSIVAAGDDGGAVALARLGATGALDPTFGNGGVAITSIGTKSAATGVALRPADSKIVAAGYGTASDGTADFAVARYLGSATVAAASVRVAPTSVRAATFGHPARTAHRLHAAPHPHLGLPDHWRSRLRSPGQ